MLSGKYQEVILLMPFSAVLTNITSSITGPVLSRHQAAGMARWREMMATSETKSAMPLKLQGVVKAFGKRLQGSQRTGLIRLNQAGAADVGVREVPARARASRRRDAAARRSRAARLRR